MKTTVAQIQRCRPGLGLPGNAQETLLVFKVVGQLQTLLLDLEKVRRPLLSVLPGPNPFLTRAPLLCRRSRLCSPRTRPWTRPWTRPRPGPWQRSSPVLVLQSQNPPSWRPRSVPSLGNLQARCGPLGRDRLFNLEPVRRRGTEGGVERSQGRL